MPVPREERCAHLPGRARGPHLPRYHWIDTLYALPEVAIYAKIIDLEETPTGSSTSRGCSPTSASASTRRTATAPSSTR